MAFQLPTTMITIYTIVGGDKVYVKSVTFNRDRKLIPTFTMDPNQAMDWVGPAVVDAFLDRVANYPGYTYQREYTNVPH